jgi:short-subunit dehydrogenase
MHVVITGASSGIGESMARAWARRGADLTLVARRTQLLEALAQDLKVKTHIVAADLSDTDRCADWLASAEAALGPIDVLVNNAGVQLVGPAELEDRDASERLFRLNVFTPLHLIRAVLPSMLARRDGAIVNISSLSAINPTPNMISYCGSKAAIGAASEALHAELHNTGVHVLTVYPGPVKTAMADAAVEKIGGVASRVPMGDSDELADKIIDAIAMKRDRIIYPATYYIGAWFPRITHWILARMTPQMRIHKDK